MSLRTVFLTINEIIKAIAIALGVFIFIFRETKVYSYLYTPVFIRSISVYTSIYYIHICIHQYLLGNPGRGGGGVKIPRKKFVQRKMAGKKIRAAITSEKKIRASKEQSTNSLEKKFLQRLNALKKNPAET